MRVGTWTLCRRKSKRPVTVLSSCLQVWRAARDLADNSATWFRTSELLAGLPLTDGDVKRFGPFFSKALLTTLRRDKLTQKLNILVADVQKRCQELRGEEIATAHPEWRVLDLFDGAFMTPATFAPFLC